MALGRGTMDVINNPMRLTKIVCTLGPSCNSPETISAVQQAGMNVARFNFSHGTHDDHRKNIALVKDLNKKDGVCVALLLDTKGPEIRTGDVAEKIEITKGQEVVFSFVPKPDEKRTVIMVNYGEFGNDVKKAEIILLDNGTMSFNVVSVEKDGSVIATSNDDGKIGSRRHVNLPGADISLPSMTEKDWTDLRLGIELEMDFVAPSFIRTGGEVKEIADFLKKNNSTMRIISKIETRQAVTNIDAIIAESDGIMVARGDLGAEMPYEKIPAVQDMIVRKCLQAGKPVIVATQMLESMIENPMPTRAEVTDVAHAATTRTDCTMLSGETAAGKHPAGAVEAMSRILCETEAHQSADLRDKVCSVGERSALADAAVSMALAVAAPAIVVLTRTGRTAQAVSQFRSNLPIFAFTESPAVQRYLQFLHGILPMTIKFEKDPETTLDNVFAEITKRKLLKSGQNVVVISDTKTKTGSMHAVHIRTLP